MKYYILDNTNHIVRAFSSYSSAFQFKAINNRFDWKIITK